MTKMIRNIVNAVIGKGYQRYNKIPFSLQKDDNKVVVFNTAMETDNLGDYIIMYYCYQILQEVFEDRQFVNFSTHKIPSMDEENIVKKTKYKFVCGTNLLTSHIEQWWNWRLPEGFRNKINYRNVILLGAGWNGYQDECSNYSKLIYRSILNPSIIHSVRDEYTEKKLKAVGIKNVINTGCPTMWRLTPEFCREIPHEKAENVVTTITDYRRDIENDNIMLKILSRNYKNVYLWIQGKKDEEYLKLLNVPSNVILIERNLESYESILEKGSIDYVGTRLHAGIFALNHKVRSIVIAVDNRAIEIAKDTGLPIVLRENIKADLEENIKQCFKTEIHINMKNICIFKAQFEK